MVARSFLITLALLAVALPADAADLTKIERAIRKEPVYKTKTPKFCLLAFGPEADYRVWLVLDGDILYVDRDGNGDLTEPGESTGPDGQNTDPCSFRPITIFGPDGKAEEKFDFALFGWFDYKAGRPSAAISPAVSVTWKGRWFGSWGDETGPATWGAKPAEAPILHVGGPLQMGFEVPEQYALTWKGDSVEINVGVGTKGLGRGSFVHLSYANDAIPKDIFPTVVLEFAAQSPGGGPVIVKAVLKQRC